MVSLSLSPKLAKLSPKEFEEMFNKDIEPYYKGVTWQEEYKKIGGKLPSPKKSDK